MMSLVEGKERVVCEECHKPESQANTCCSSCGLICQVCLENHRRMRSFSDHVTVSLKVGQNDSLQAKIDAIKSADNTSQMKCDKHGEPLKMYCRTCKKLICSSCTLGSHQQPNHQCDVILTAAETQRNEMKQNVASVKNTQSMASETVETAKQTKEVFSKQQEVFKDLIESSFQELHEQLDKLKQKFLGEVETEIDTRLTEVSERIAKASTKTRETEHLVKMAEQALEHTSDQEFLDLKRFMVTRLKENSPKKTTIEDPLISSVELSTSLSGELMQIILSHIQCYHSPSLEQSYASGKGIERAIVDKETNFCIYSVTNVGTPCMEKKSLDVEIVVSRSGESVPVSVTPGSEMGSHVVKYVPKLKGEYKVSIRIEGNAISDSPYFVVARETRLKIDQPITVISQLEWPWGVACSVDRETYITKNYHHTIAVFSKEGKQVRKIGLKGQKAGNLWHPTGVAVDDEGNVFVADGQENGRVQKLSNKGQLLAIYSKLHSPQGVLLNKQGDQLYVCDKGHRTVVVLDTCLKETKIFGELDHFSLTDGFENVSGHLVGPHSLAEDENGLIYVSDTQEGVGCVHVFTVEGEHLRKIKHPTSNIAPTGIAIDDDLLYVCDAISNCVFIFRTSGELVTTCGSFGKMPGQFYSPMSLAVDCDGFLCVTDFSNNRVQVF